VGAVTLVVPDVDQAFAGIERVGGIEHLEQQQQGH
jgi:hypothetical protein